MEFVGHCASPARRHCQIWSCHSIHVAENHVKGMLKDRFVSYPICITSSVTETRRASKKIAKPTLYFQNHVQNCNVFRNLKLDSLPCSKTEISV